MVERIKLNGMVLRLGKEKSKLDVNPRYLGRTLDDCYGKPSHMKELIYAEWANWFKTFKSYEFGIMSYNTNVFTLNGVIRTDNDQLYYVTIYPTHQEAYPIV